MAIADGISVVVKNMKKVEPGFIYEYIKGDNDIEIDMKNPGKNLMPLDPRDISITDKISEFVEKYKINYLHDNILPRSLFGIESDFVEKYPQKVRNIDEGEFDPSKEIKLLTNDRAGKAGRAKWFIASKDVIKTNIKYVEQWQVVVSSANAGGQKRDNQLEIVDNMSAFGRARVALKSFKTQEEAVNFYKYTMSYIIRFAFLMTDEALSSLGKRVPDILDYSSLNKIVDFTKNIDEQLCSLIRLNVEEVKYIKERIENLRRK